MKVTGVFNNNIGQNEVLRYVRVKDEKTEEIKLLEPHELLDPDNVAVGDLEAYKVDLLSENVFKYNNTY